MTNLSYNQQKNITLWQVGGLTFTALLGTLFHFVYEWTNLLIFAPLSGVNESTWEHMKLLFFPMFIFAIIQSFFFCDHDAFWQIKLNGALLGLILIPAVFYTYNGAFGKSPDWFNICIFYITAFFVYFYEWTALKKPRQKTKLKYLGLAVLFIISLAFVVFTFFPPKLPLFLDPLTFSYGISP